MVKRLVATQLDFTPKTPELVTIGVAVKQETGDTITLVLTDEEGHEIEDSALFRLWLSTGGKLQASRIVSREKFDQYLELENGQIKLN